MTRHPEGSSDRAAVAAEALSVLGTVALIAWLPSLTRDGRWPVTILVVGAILLGSAATLVDLLTRSRTGTGTTDGSDPDGSGADTTSADATVTTVVVLGEEPTELQRHSLLLAHQVGPCIAITTHAVDDAVATLGVPIVEGTSVSAALDTALDDIDTDAVLLLSGRAVPIMEACRAAAGRLDERHPWAVGRSRPFNPEAIELDGHGRIGAELRHRVTTQDPALWEPNATLLRTAELRRHRLPARQARGSWLRARRQDGGSALVVDDVLSLVATPASATTSGPDAFAQQRGAAADAAGAFRTAHGTARLRALLMVARESFAWSLPTWLLVLFIGTVTGELPFRTAHGAVPALYAVVLVLRWYGIRRSLGIPLRPMVDLRSTIERVPGSLAALPSALTGRVIAGRRRVSVRPLLWAAVLTVAVLVTALVDHGPDARMTVPAATAALLTLVASWALCIQVLAERGWERTTFRLGLSLPARVGPCRARVLNGSPGGMAVSLEEPPGTHRPGAPLQRGDHLDVDVTLDDSRTVVIGTQVMWAGTGPDGTIVGLAVEGAGGSTRDDSAASAWAAQLLRVAAGPPPVAADAPVSRATDNGARPLPERIGDAAAIGLVAVLSVALLAVLGSAMLGLQVAVIRSASMTPTIGQGSIVISESIPVRALAPGDVVTRPASGDQGPVTHRLVSAHRSGATTTVVTRGDANTTTETWSVPTRSTLQRVRWSAPSIGEAVSAARSNTGVAVGAAVVVGLLVVAVRSPRRRERRPAPV